MSTSLFHLRVVEIGLTMSDLDQLNYGDVVDIMTEKANDSFAYKELATQADFDMF